MVATLMVIVIVMERKDIIQRHQQNALTVEPWNAAIIFMDEPTSGLDARAAAVVMQTVSMLSGCLQSLPLA